MIRNQHYLNSFSSYCVGQLREVSYCSTEGNMTGVLRMRNTCMFAHHKPLIFNIFQYVLIPFNFL